MRYKFRGICISNGLFKGEWVYGDLSQRKNGDCYIGSLDEGIRRRVDPETVGQYTGLKDKNGKEIYEGDIVKSKRSHIAAVEWDEENGRYLAFTATRRIMYVGQEPAVEIIGNIHEHPHLLGGDKG